MDKQDNPQFLPALKDGVSLRGLMKTSKAGKQKNTPIGVFFYLEAGSSACSSNFFFQ